MEDEKDWERRRRVEVKVSHGSALWPTSIGRNLTDYIFIIFTVCFTIWCGVLFIGQW